MYTHTTTRALFLPFSKLTYSHADASIIMNSQAPSFPLHLRTHKAVVSLDYILESNRFFSRDDSGSGLGRVGIRHISDHLRSKNSNESRAESDRRRDHLAGRSRCCSCLSHLTCIGLVISLFGLIIGRRRQNRLALLDLRDLKTQEYVSNILTSRFWWGVLVYVRAQWCPWWFVHP